MVGAVASVIALYLVQRYTTVSLFLYGAIGILTCCIVGYLASLIIPAKRKPLEGLTVYTLGDRSATPIPVLHNPAPAE